eukprot:767434-Hanusia_phi.AAC.3
MTSSSTPFVTLYCSMMLNAKNTPYIRWGEEGATVLIANPHGFATRIIPQYFKHSNLASFIRQLNVYGFHKTTQDPDICEFAHVHFKRDDPGLMQNIRRKERKPGNRATKPMPVSARQENKKESVETDSALQEFARKLDQISVRQIQLEGMVKKAEKEKEVLQQRIQQAENKNRGMEEKLFHINNFLVQLCDSVKRTVNGVVASMESRAEEGAKKTGKVAVGAGRAVRPQDQASSLPTQPSKPPRKKQKRLEGHDVSRLKEYVEKLGSIGELMQKGKMREEEKRVSCKDVLQGVGQLYRREGASTEVRPHTELAWQEQQSPADRTSMQGTQQPRGLSMLPHAPQQPIVSSSLPQTDMKMQLPEQEHFTVGQMGILQPFLLATSPLAKLTSTLGSSFSLPVAPRLMEGAADGVYNQKNR